MAFFNPTIMSMFVQHLNEQYWKGCSPPLHNNPDFIRRQHRKFFNPSNSRVDHDIFYTSTHKIDVSSTPLNQLKRITLQDLVMEQATKGGYLVLRTIEPCFRVVAITTIVEDHKGNAVLFALYNFASEIEVDPDDVLPVGTIFILKEPYIKMSSSNDCMLRCDCPTDIIILHEGHKLLCLTDGITWRNTPNPKPMNPVSRGPRPKTDTDWKDRGNELFKERKYEFATHCYLMALQEAEEMASDKDLHVIKLNLSAAYLQRGFFETALDYARMVLGFEPGNPKALLRAGRSCYQLRKYEDAQQYLELFHKLNPDHQEGAKELNDCKNRVLEQKTGNFNMYRMCLERGYRPGQKIDCADYVGPVKVVEIPGKGRGVVATKDLEVGTLVAVSKALAFASEKTDEIRMQFNTDQTIDFGSDIRLVTQVAQSIAKNPNIFGPVIYNLFDGHPKSNHDAVQVFCDPKTKEEPIADVQKIKDILNFNCFEYPSVTTKILDGSDLEIPGGRGLYAFPSFFNHSCVPNGHFLMYNDVMFIRVVHFVRAGEEIMLTYLQPCDLTDDRYIRFGNRGFQCACELCKIEKDEPADVFSKRSELVSILTSKFQKKIKDGDVSLSLISNFKKWMKKFELTYAYCASSTCPKYGFLCMYPLLAEAYSFFEDKYQEEVKCHKACIDGLGLNCDELIKAVEKDEPLKLTENAWLNDCVIGDVLGIISIYEHHNEIENAKKWIKVLVALEKLYSGGDINVVKFKYYYVRKLI